MEEKLRERQRAQHPLPTTTITITTTATLATTATTLSRSIKDSASSSSSSSSHLLHKQSITTGTRGDSSSMGGNRSGSTSSSVGWMEGGGGGGGGGDGGGHGNNSSSSSSSSGGSTTTTTTTTTSSSTTTATTITTTSHSSRSKTPTPTPTPTTPRQPSNRDSGYHTDFSFSPATFSSQLQFTFDTFPQDIPRAGSPAAVGSFSSQEQGTSPRLGSTPPAHHHPLLLPPPPCRFSLMPAPGWQPRRLLPDVDSDDDDEGDDDAFVSDNVTITATSHLPGLQPAIPSAASHEASLRQQQSPRALMMPPPPRRRSRSSNDETDARGDNDDDDDDHHHHHHRQAEASSRLRGEAVEERRSASRDSSNSPMRSVAFRGVRRLEVVEDSRNDDDEEGGGVSSTDYHHAPLSLVTLPGGERIRPLLARTIATQTPHLHCQLIDQILDCPPDFPQIARGSAVRRLRYYSEGEESVGVSTLTRGPLPDLVPVTQGHRERSLSAPDLESLQGQRRAAREVGRELRRISDEFLRTHHEALRDHGHHDYRGALAALHAELNGVAAFFLTGVRRFLYRGFAGYFRHVFHWTRQAMADSQQEQTLPRPSRLRRDSSVDDRQHPR